MGRRTAAAEHLGCWLYSVGKHIGPADVILRFGARDDCGWLQVRLDHFKRIQELRLEPKFWATNI
jgi:hypothetical protein